MNDGILPVYIGGVTCHGGTVYTPIRRGGGGGWDEEGGGRTRNQPEINLDFRLSLILIMTMSLDLLRSTKQEHIITTHTRTDTYGLHSEDQ